MVTYVYASGRLEVETDLAHVHDEDAALSFVQPLFFFLRVLHTVPS